jgi:hypothetical protein
MSDAFSYGVDFLGFEAMPTCEIYGSLVCNYGDGASGMNRFPLKKKRLRSFETLVNIEHIPEVFLIFIVVPCILVTSKFFFTHKCTLY